jgi:hypothetical protein
MSKSSSYGSPRPARRGLRPTVEGIGKTSLRSADSPLLPEGQGSALPAVDQEFGRWTLEGLAEGWQRYQVAAAGKYGEAVPLPPPFDFEIATTDWPRYRD